jgi:type I restriction enzyme S subunit
VDSELGEIPEGWGVGVLDDYIKSTLGGDWGTDSITSENNVAVQCIRGADIAALNAGGMGKMPTRYIKTASYEKRKIHPGNIVLEISGGSPTQSTGRSTLVTEEILQRSNLPLITSNFCRAIQFGGIQQSLYISYLLKHLYANDEFLQYENGSTGIKNFAFTLFCSEHPIVLPMSAILVHFEAMVRNFHKRPAMVRAESDIIEDIRDSLLPKLISGEIRVPEAEHLL